MSENEKSEKSKVIDFRKVKVEVKIDEFKVMDVSKSVANGVHQATCDLGLDEICREIYRNGKAEIPESYLTYMAAVVKSPECNLVVGLKMAVIELLTK